MRKFPSRRLTRGAILTKRTLLPSVLALSLVAVLVAGAPRAPSDLASREAAADQAAQLRKDGAYEQAAALYADALRRGGTPPENLALAAGEAYLAAAQYGPAQAMADRALQANPAATDAYLLKGQALGKLGRTNDALQAFTVYLGRDPVGGYAAFLGGELLQAQGEEARAREWYSRAIEAGVAKLWEVAAMRRIGASLSAEGRPAAAAPWFERALAGAADLEDRGQPVWYDGELNQRGAEDRRPAILMSVASARQAAEEPQGAVAAYREIVNLYPSSGEAQPALDALADLGEYFSVDAYIRGRVLLQAGRSGDADVALTRAIAGGSAGRVGAVFYYRGLARRDAGDPAAAISDFSTVARQYPNDPLAPEAGWQAARLAEMNARPSDAVGAYLAVADSFPTSQRAAQALVQAGWLAGQAGSEATALATWSRLSQDHPDPAARAQGSFWLGRQLLGLGRAGEAAAALEGAQEEAPLAYEGLRARDLARGGVGREPYVGTWTTSLAAANPQDPDACRAWIDSWADSPEPGASLAGRLIRIERLLRVGLAGPAQAEALEALLVAGPLGRFDLALALSGRGLYPVGIYAASALAAASPARSIDNAPPCLQRVLFPLAYGDLVQKEAGRYGLDPYVVLALLRQESWFGAGARSSAQALGLSQVTPPTAREIARALGEQNFSQQDLLRPKESIAFGAWYLANQYQSFGRRALLALAAYNAGPGSVTRWAGGSVGAADPDEFVQNIDYSETRAYVRTIYETYSRYRQLYG